MKNRSIRVGTICLIALIAVLFLLNFFESLFVFSSYALLFAFFLSFVVLWGCFVAEKNVIMAIWIPTVVLFIMGRPVALTLMGEDWLYHGPEVTRYYVLLIALTIFGIGLPRIFHSNDSGLKAKRNVRYLNAGGSAPAFIQWLFRDIPLAGIFHLVENRLIKRYKPRYLRRRRIETAFMDGLSVCILLIENIRNHKFFAWTSRIAITKKKIRKNLYFKLIITLGYTVTFGCYLVTKIAEYISMQGKTYLDYYLAHDVTLPWIVTFLASLGIYFMCIQLAMARRKTTVCVVLLLNIISTGSALMIGQRNPFVLAVLFSVVVIYLKNREVWKIRISKKIATTLLVCAVVAGLVLILAMAVLSGSRNGQEVDSAGLFERVLGFIRDQGNTFEAICQGITHRNYLRIADNHGYTFSAVLDYYKYGQVGNWLLGTPELPGGNTVERALMSNDFAHKMSYLVLGENYLRGAGLGTSYVIETFLDFGVLGVIFINLFYVIFLTNISKKFGRSLMVDSVFIYALLKVFFIGRDNALIPFSGLMTLHFIAVVIGVYASYYITKVLRAKGILRNEK